MSNGPDILRCDGLCKSYQLGEIEVPVLKGVTLSVRAGEFLTVVGASGSGKSTLLHILGALDTPDRGRVIFDGGDVFAADEAHRDRLRNEQFGFVFQFYHLLPELTVLENVVMPLLVGSSVYGWLKGRPHALARGREVLERLGLAHRAGHLPNQLSGGERQRAAIGRAIITKPTILYADEPTGNLDAATGRGIFQALLELNRAGQTVVMVTHDAELARAAHRTVRLIDGRIAAG